MPGEAQQLAHVLVGGASFAGLRGAADHRAQRLRAVAARALRLAEVDRRQLIQRWLPRRAAPAELDHPIKAASLLLGLLGSADRSLSGPFQLRQRGLEVAWLSRGQLRILLAAASQLLVCVDDHPAQ